MADIFLSYTREDSGIAGQLARTLEGFGFSVWWDGDILHGEEFVDSIQRQLDAAKCVIVLWSLNSVKSGFVRDEAALAQEQRKLIPVRIQPEGPPALGYRQIQTADLTQWRPGVPSAEIERLRESIERLAGARSTTTGPRIPTLPLPRSLASDAPILIIPPEARAHNPFALPTQEPLKNPRAAVPKPPSVTLQPKPSFDFDKWRNDNRAAIYGLGMLAFSLFMWWLRQ